MDKIQKAIVQSLKDISIDLSENDILILSEWARGIYSDGWNNAKKLLKDKTKNHAKKI